MDLYPVALRFRVFDHDHRVRAGGQRRAGHDGNALTRTYGAGKVPSRANFPARTQFDGRRSDVLRAHGKSIADGAMKRRIIAVRHNVLRQDSAARLAQRHNFPSQA